MARRLLAGAGPGRRTLVVAGNLHTAVRPSRFGVPLGAVLAAHRPGVREIRIEYLGGRYYNARAAPVPSAHPLASPGAAAGSPQRKPRPRAPLRPRSGRSPAALAPDQPVTAVGIWQILRHMA